MYMKYLRSLMDGKVCKTTLLDIYQMLFILYKQEFQ